MTGWPVGNLLPGNPGTGFDADPGCLILKRAAGTLQLLVVGAAQLGVDRDPFSDHVRRVRMDIHSADRSEQSSGSRVGKLAACDDQAGCGKQCVAPLRHGCGTRMCRNPRDLKKILVSTPVPAYDTDCRAASFQLGSLLNMQLNIGCDLPGPLILTVVPRQGERLGKRHTVAVSARPREALVVLAGEYAAAQHAGSEPRAFLVGPDRNGKIPAELDALSARDRIHRDASGNHAQRTVKSSAAGLAVQMGSCQHPRGRLTGELKAGKNITDRVDTNREAPARKPVADTIARAPLLLAG